MPTPAISTAQRDFKYIDIDPLTEIVSNHVIRRKDRKLREYFASQVVFIQGIFSLVECLFPGCKGHQRYGYVAADNAPVIYRYHDQGSKEAVYAVYRNTLNRPIRVPQDGDPLINGIKWTLRSLDSAVTNSQTILDCLIANLKLQTLKKGFCLECLFFHRNGLGLQFEKLLRTIVSHVVAYGRYLEKESFFPVSRLEQGMTLRLKRIFFEKENCFRQCYAPSREGFNEHMVVIEKDTAIASYPSFYKHGRFVDVDFSILRHIDLVSTFNVTLQCGCDLGRMRHQKAHVAVLRKNHHQGMFNLALGSWKAGDTSFEDPLWMHSLLGQTGPCQAVNKVTATPLASVCSSCQNITTIKSVTIPDTTWLLPCEVSSNLAHCSLEGLSNLSTYVLSGVIFRLAFALIFNHTTGHFSSMNFYNGEWSYYEDNLGGLFKSCNPAKFRYKDRSNVRIYYIRSSASDENHRCLTDAFNRLRS